MYRCTNHILKFSKALQKYYCRFCGGVHSPKLGKLNKLKK